MFYWWYDDEQPNFLQRWYSCTHYIFTIITTPMWLDQCEAGSHLWQPQLRLQPTVILRSASARYIFSLSEDVINNCSSQYQILYFCDAEARIPLCISLK